MQFLKMYHELAQNIRNAGGLSAESVQPLLRHSGDQYNVGLDKLLVNAWSAEYALRISPVVNDEAYLKSAILWTFPQAYYSVLFTARAYLNTRGVNISNEALIRKQINQLVVKGAYPSAINSYQLGVPGAFRTNRKGLNRLGWWLGSLSDTRELQFRTKAKELQANPKMALRSPSTGAVLQVNQLGKHNLKYIGRDIAYTTFWDVLTRLRISSTNRELEALVDKLEQPKAVAADLVTITEYVNSINEIHIATAIGQDAYRALVAKSPSYMNEGFVKDRMHTILSLIP